MIVPIALPADAKSICWGCKNYEWTIILGAVNMWDHACYKGLESGDEVKECTEFE